MHSRTVILTKYKLSNSGLQLEAFGFAQFGYTYNSKYNNRRAFRSAKNDACVYYKR